MVLVLTKKITFVPLSLIFGMGTDIQISWQQAWQNKRFRLLLIIGGAGFFFPIFAWPAFLKHIEQRNGVVLNDVILAMIPIKDLSVPIFICLWAVALLMLVRIIQQPKLFLMFMYSYWAMFLLRMLTIQLTPLNPPVGLLKLRDPISNLFYGNGGVFITKDLFFSGHTATLLLIFLFLEKKWEKWLVLFLAIAVAVMVLFQHIHYSIDVLLAPIFSFGIYWVVKKWLGNLFYETKQEKELFRKTLVN